MWELNDTVAKKMPQLHCAEKNSHTSAVTVVKAIDSCPILLYVT